MSVISSNTFFIDHGYPFSMSSLCKNFQIYSLFWGAYLRTNFSNSVFHYSFHCKRYSFQSKFDFISSSSLWCSLISSSSCKRAFSSILWRKFICSLSSYFSLLNLSILLWSNSVSPLSWSIWYLIDAGTPCFPPSQSTFIICLFKNND